MTLMWHCDELSPEVIMLDCEESSDSCKHCQENGTYWAIQLDQDLLETIVSIYPEWFKDCNFLPNMAHDNTHQMMTEGGKIIIPLYHTRDMESPPKAIVDEASLQKAMNKNKESLKVKLLLRRPLNQLVEQGIMPPLKTSPHFHEQRQKLERAKMGDMLKNKIQRRPDRRELIQQHILEDTTIDPSLQDKQRQLKKARLADDLNDRLSHRPGPLELIKGNILQTDEKFAQAVKEGHIPFKRTCEGQTQKHPPQRFVLDEDSGSEGAPSPQDTAEHSQSSIPSLDTGDASTPMHGSPDSQVDIKPRITTPSSISNESVSHISNQLVVGTSVNSFNRLENGASSTKSRKKSKSKSQPKTRTIKFHEYKGPPSAQKSQMSSSAADSETSYELLLQQQQLFLQWQLEWQQKYPQIILPVAQKPNGDQVNGGGSGHLNTQLCDQSIIQESTASSQRNLSKLEEMKVSDLKAELKKRNLPVSGSKPQLIERLKPYSDFSTAVNQLSSFADGLTAVTTISNNSLPVTVGGILLDTAATSQNKADIFPLSAVTTSTSPADSVASNVLCEDVALGVYQIPTTIAQLVTSRPPSVAPMDVDTSPHMTVEAMDVSDSVSSMSSEELVRMQQKKIEELQRELQRSQMQLQQQQQNFLHQQSQPQQAIPSTSMHLHPQQVADSIKKTNNQASHVDSKQSQRQILQQRFQEKIHQQQQQTVQPIEQRQQSQQPLGTTSTQASHPTSAAVKASLAAFLHNQHAATSLASISVTSPVMSQIAASQPVVSIPARVLTAPRVSPTADQLKDYSKNQTEGVTSSVTTTPIASFKNPTYPNGINHQRMSSLPNISGQLLAKQIEKRIKNESPFVSKPPPDYNEATKQLIKSQQPLQVNPELREHNSSGQCNQRTLKSQVIDDVLEILIKNGELPPSAAQDPSSDNIRISNSSTESTYSSVSNFPLIPTSQSHNKLQMTTSNSAPRLAIGNTLMTPPSSSVLGDTETNTNTPLDFDFHLDLDDIEAMDLGSVLVGDGTNNNNIIKSEHNQLPINNIVEETVNSVALPDSGASMDVELPDWLDVMMPTTSTSIPAHHSANNNIVEQNNARNSYRNNDPDPLLSTLANSNDPYDLFSIEDLDFKSSNAELNLHSWDKVDFAA